MKSKGEGIIVEVGGGPGDLTNGLRSPDPRFLCNFWILILSRRALIREIRVDTIEEEPEIDFGRGTSFSDPGLLISFFDLVLDRNFLPSFVARVVTISSIPQLPRARSEDRILGEKGPD